MSPGSGFEKDVLHHSLLASRQAANLLRDHFGNSSTYKVSYKDDKSIVTEVDSASQSLLISYLAGQFPGVPFIAEEQSAGERRIAGISSNNKNCIAGHDYYFVIDPLDGTASFVAGIPFYCVSVALCKGTKTLSGVLVDPNHHEEFTAISGEGAFLNGKRICVSNRNKIEELYLNVNHNKFDQSRFDNINENILKRIKRFHKLGSLCLEVSYVAAGRLDGTINNELSMWDIAAAGLILEEAGGRWSLMDGTKPMFPTFEKIDICGSNKIIHDSLLSLIDGDNRKESIAHKK